MHVFLQMKRYFFAGDRSHLLSFVTPSLSLFYPVLFQIHCILPFPSDLLFCPVNSSFSLYPFNLPFVTMNQIPVFPTPQHLSCQLNHISFPHYFWSSTTEAVIMITNNPFSNRPFWTRLESFRSCTGSFQACLWIFSSSWIVPHEFLVWSGYQRQWIIVMNSVTFFINIICWKTII